MTTERNAQGVDGLAEVMGLLREATPGPWETASSCEYATHWEVCDCGGAFEPDGKTKVIAVVQDYCTAAEGDAATIAAAVNYLRSHGGAIRRLTEAAHKVTMGRHTHSAIGVPDSEGCGVCDHNWRHEIHYRAGESAAKDMAELRAALAKFPEPRP